MRTLEAVLTQPLFEALGWALLHSLWQGAGVALLLAGALALLKGRGARARYWVACAALLLMLLLPVVTVWRLSGESVAGSEVDEMSLGREGRPASASASVTAAHVEGERAVGLPGVGLQRGAQADVVQLDGLLPWLCLVWALGVAALSARTLGGLAYTRRLKSVGTREVAREWQTRLEELAERLSVSRPVRLLESALVEVPTAVGWLSPVILLPASALTGLTPRQLEIILAHELAHIRRHDYLVNLIQTAAETLLFYHPAVWWVSRRMRVEREHVCDDMAVAACGDALTYARALATLERLRLSRTPLALAADGGHLRGRILRLVGAPAADRRHSTVVVAVAFAAALLATVACTGAVLSQNQKNVAASVAPSAPQNNNANAARKSSPTAGLQLTPEMARLVEADDTEGEDPEVRRAALTALGKRTGTVVVMDPQTGRVYAVVNQEWGVRRAWLPASTTKMITALAGLGERAFDPAERVKVADRREAIDLTDAMAFSNNPYFYTIAERLGTETLINYARRVGYGEATGINYEGETAGRLAAPPKPHGAGEFGSHGEGLEVTPVQLAVFISAFANGGSLVVPRVPRTAEDAARFETQVRRRVDIPRETMDRIVPGLLAAVERGTGSGAKDVPVRVAGKTGSAGGKLNHGIFAAYAPAERPRFVVVVLTKGPKENGLEASGVAGAIYKSLAARLTADE